MCVFFLCVCVCVCLPKKSRQTEKAHFFGMAFFHRPSRGDASDSTLFAVRSGQKHREADGPTDRRG